MKFKILQLFKVLLLNTIWVFPLWANCPTDEPAVCPIETQLPNGRWYLSQVTGDYTLEGNEVFCQFLDAGFCDISDDYSPISGNFMIQKIGGIEENYIDVACDGSVTGKGSERITGTIDKTANIMYDYTPSCIAPGTFEDPQDMSWDITIERTYDITGNITGNGQAELTYTINTATIDIVGNFAFGVDCYWLSYDDNIIDFDISGDTENVQLLGVFDPINYTWQPNQLISGDKSWLDSVLHRLRLNATENGINVSFNPVLEPQGSSQPQDQLYNTYFIQDSVTVTQDIQYDTKPSTPSITNLTLQEPSQYIKSVNVNTQAIASIDWRGQPPGEVKFTYGGTVETVAGSDTVIWDFDAGEPGDTIQAIAMLGTQESVPYTKATPKVQLPIWAETPASWSGSAGIKYQGNLNWPISLETTRTINSLKLMSGLWGINGGASSQYTATAFSNGSSGSGDLNAQATFSFAGKSINFQMQGSNTTSLSCDMLTTEGDGTVNIPITNWQKTLNPITAIPGLQSAACSLSQFLCSIIQSVGIKASANAAVSGTGFYAGDSAEMMWTGGSLSGSIGAKVGAGISLPKPLNNAAGVSVSGGGNGCIEIQVAPDFSINTLGGSVNINAQAHFLGLSAEASKNWPFGDPCGSKSTQQTLKGTSSAWVPIDGHLAMAHTTINNEFIGVAVWSELSTGENRPAGHLKYRFFNGTTGLWGNIHTVIDTSTAANSPSVSFDKNGQLLIVYQSSSATIPTTVSQLNDFVNTYELAWKLIDSNTELEVDTGVLTNNAMHDFGPDIVEDTNGELSLFWQRANGIEITGTASNNVSIHGLQWDADNSQWVNETTVVSGLKYTYGWSVAAQSSGEQVLGLIIDTDEDFTTSDDRELFRIIKQSGIWGTMQQITTNSINDDSVLTAYPENGQAILIWREGDIVKEIIGDIAGHDFPLMQFEQLEGVGHEFSAGLLAKQGNLYALVWPQSTELMLELNRRDGTSTTWSESTKLIENSQNQDQSIHSLSIVNEQLTYGWASRDLLPDQSGFENMLTPKFGFAGLSNTLFKNGFEE